MNFIQPDIDYDKFESVLRQWGEEMELRAFGAVCPMPRCGALVVAYEAGDSVKEVTKSSNSTWEFVCAECGAEFTAPRRDLLFQNIPREWLFSQISRA
jgi:hypothetical protein